MIKFKRIFWKNLLSTGNTGIEIDLQVSKTTILFGPSGSGKSTLLDALTFCLFNKPFRNINKPKLVNAVNERDCLVEVEFSSNGRNYKVVRGIKPSIFEIYINDQLINQDANNKDYQNYLEDQILKINYKTFLQVVMLGAANFTPFMQLKPSDRRQIIEDLLDIQIFSAMNGLLKEKFSETKSRHQEINFELSGLDEKMEMIKKYLNSIEEKNKNKIKELESKINVIKAEITDNQAAILNLQQEKESVIADNLKSIENQLKKFHKMKVTLDNNAKRIGKEIKFYQENSNCPTCRQDIESTFREKEIQNKKKGLESALLAFEKLQESIDSVENKRREILKNQEKTRTIENKIREFELQIEHKNKSIDLYLDEINKLNALDEDSLEYKNTLKNLKSKQNALEKQKKQIIHQQQVIDYANLILKDTGVKSKIVKEYIPYINKYVNTFLNAMSFYVTFKLDENFEEQIKSKGRDFFNYENFSEGERQRLDLALLFTWRCVARAKNSVNTNLLIMDEIFDSYLDTAATENVLAIFEEEMFSNTNILVISHKENIVDKFDRVIKYRTEKGFSKMEL